MRYLQFLLSFTCVSISFGQNTNISGIINHYSSVNSILSNTLSVSNTSGFLVNDQVLIIQMQGASIQSNNNNTYGSITAYNNAGNYEFSIIQAVLPGAIVLNGALQKSYSAAAGLQIVRVPVYQNAVVNGPLTCLPWNGNTGGVLAFAVCSDLTLQAPIVVSGKGFRGGKVKGGDYTCAGDTLTYVGSSFGPDSMYLAQKGEGIYRNTANDDAGRGRNANGGGGGNDDNGGGAGGANFGLGGRGGDFQSPISCPPNILIQCGGIGGQALNYNNLQNKVFMGGGGGAGHQNNFTATPGGTGGGIIIIKSRVIIGNNQMISADGENVTDSISIDGQGGGGAGGAILIDANSIFGLQLSAKGGYGGSDNYSGWDCHAKGGGGGGGVIWTTTALSGITTNVNGGSPGLFLSQNSPCYNTSLGASAGQSGTVLSGLSLIGNLNPCENQPVDLKEFFGIDNSLIIYPNPSKERIFIFFVRNNVDGNAVLEIFNALGVLQLQLNVESAQILQQQGVEIIMLSKGLHLVRVRTEKHTWNSRLMVE